MVKIYSPELFRFSRELALAVDASGTPIDAAFWLYEEEGERWRLYLASPKVVSKGPTAVYRVINSQLRMLTGGKPDGLIQLDDIKAIPPDAPELAYIRKSAMVTKPGTNYNSAGRADDQGPINVSWGRRATSGVIWTHGSLDHVPVIASVAMLDNDFSDSGLSLEATLRFDNLIIEDIRDGDERVSRVGMFMLDPLKELSSGMRSELTGGPGEFWRVGDYMGVRYNIHVGVDPDELTPTVGFISLDAFNQMVEKIEQAILSQKLALEPYKTLDSKVS